MTSMRRNNRCDVVTSHRRRYDVMCLLGIRPPPCPPQYSKPSYAYVCSRNLEVLPMFLLLNVFSALEEALLDFLIIHNQTVSVHHLLSTFLKNFSEAPLADRTRHGVNYIEMYSLHYNYFGKMCDYITLQFRCICDWN